MFSSLPRIVGIIIVDLPTGFNHEQENSNPNPHYRCEQDKKCFHDVAPQVRMIYATIDCTDDGENGFPHRQDAGVVARETAAMTLKLSQALAVLQYLDEHPSEFSDEGRARIKRVIADVPFANVMHEARTEALQRDKDRARR